MEHLFEVVKRKIEGFWFKDESFFFLLQRDLKINLSKTELLGIHIDDSKMDWILSTFGCKKVQGPFTYLGLSLGSNSKSVSI